MNPIHNINIYEGITTRYYVINNIKFHINFPIQWALDPLVLEDKCNTFLHTIGPFDCINCNCNMTVRGIFIGYCSNCLAVCEHAGINRGVCVYEGVYACMLDNDQMYERYPYMTYCNIETISDELPDLSVANFHLN